MSDDNDNGYKLMCVNEVTVDGKRSPQGRRLAYELKRGGSGLTGLGWVTPAWTGERGWVATRTRDVPTWFEIGLR